MEIMQSIDQAVDVADWPRDEEFAAYPEGARDKTLLYCPKPLSYPFLNRHRYLFKRSSPRYEEQYWVEIFAYCLGKKMDVPVPPAFVAYDSKRKQSGALIEWFLNVIDNVDLLSYDRYEKYISGGDYCQLYIPNFDRKKGEQHNFETVVRIFNDLSIKHPNLQENWKTYWAKVFTFDALIGNTDRHQDNWGIIVNPTNDGMRITPAFDNGTSMGHEISPKKFNLFDEDRLEKYVSKGCHHIKWRLADTQSAGHIELLKKIADLYPESKRVMLDSLKLVNYAVFEEILEMLINFDVPVKLTADRAKFMLKLLQYRHERLLNELEK